MAIEGRRRAVEGCHPAAVECVDEGRRRRGDGDGVGRRGGRQFERARVFPPFHTSPNNSGMVVGRRLYFNFIINFFCLI